jgi:hypothetical protein
LIQARAMGLVKMTYWVVWMLTWRLETVPARMTGSVALMAAWMKLGRVVERPWMDQILMNFLSFDGSCRIYF